MTPGARARRAAWLALYLALVLAPLGAALLAGPGGVPRPWRAALGAAFGFLAFAMLAIQFALVSRLRPLSRWFGGDSLLQFHREMAVAALAFAVAHPLLSGAGSGWRAWSPFHAPAGLDTGAAALWIAGLVVVTSLARQRLRLSYEAWQALHLGGAVALAAAGLAHILDVGTSARAPIVGGVAGAHTGLFAVLLARYRVVRPLQLRKRPWEVVANEDIGGSTRLLTLQAAGHAGLRAAAGQFAWLATGRGPLLSAQHPVSLAGSAGAAARGRLQFAIKALGDWSSTDVPALAAGRRVWVDGPFGAFTPLEASGEGLVLVAGGIGIAPMRSILLTLRERGDRRPVLLVHGAASPARLVFGDEIDALAADLDLRTVRVFERPAPDWSGERGVITAELLVRHLPAAAAERQYYLCGPPAMMDAVEAGLIAHGIPPGRIHTERFQVV